MSADLEDRRFAVLVDGDDGARSLHADNVLDGAADAKREIEFGRTVWPDEPTWRSMGSQPRRRWDAKPQAHRPARRPAFAPSRCSFAP